MGTLTKYPRPSSPRPTTREGDAGARIAERLRDGILSGHFAPGTRIRQEDIAENFGASRVPVREALRILENEGLVRLVANTGAWVAELTLAECDEIYQIRERIEPLLLRYSAPHLTPGDLVRLGELATEMAEGHRVDRFLELDREFHLGCYAGADTSQLGDLVKKLWNTTQPYRRAFTESVDETAWRIIHDEHNLIVASLRSGDVEGAEVVLAGHIRRTRLRLTRHPELFAQMTAQRR